MMTSGSRSDFAATAATIAIACIITIGGGWSCNPARQVHGAPDTSVTKTQSFEIAGRFVPAQTTFIATLLTPLDARSIAASRAEPFTASIREPLRDQDGMVLVQRGARLRGYARFVDDDGDAGRGSGSRSTRIVLEPSSVVLLSGEVWIGAVAHPDVSALAASNGREQRAHLDPGTIIVCKLLLPLVPPGSSFR